MKQLQGMRLELKEGKLWGMCGVVVVGLLNCETFDGASQNHQRITVSTHWGARDHFFFMVCHKKGFSNISASMSYFFFFSQSNLWASARVPTGSVPATQSQKREVGTIALWPHARACWERVEREWKRVGLIDGWCGSECHGVVLSTVVNVPCVFLSSESWLKPCAFMKCSLCLLVQRMVITVSQICTQSVFSIHWCLDAFNCFLFPCEWSVFWSDNHRPWLFVLQLQSTPLELQKNPKNFAVLS